MKRSRLNLVALLTIIFFLPIAADAQSAEPPAVLAAVAPFYPKLSLPNTSGSVMVEVTIDARGNVAGAKAMNGHPLLQIPSVEAAKSWRFAPASDGSIERRARLMFEYPLVPAGTPENELWPVYKPPYGIEVKHREVKTRVGRRR